MLIQGLFIFVKVILDIFVSSNFDRRRDVNLTTLTDFDALFFCNSVKIKLVQLQAALLNIKKHADFCNDRELGKKLHLLGDEPRAT